MLDALQGIQTGRGTALFSALETCARGLQRILVPGRKQRILMLTDGEPSDVDVFDDDYLVEDARHAVTSAASRGIRTFCLTLDRHADAYVRRIFGARNYLIADRANAFAGQTGHALVKLIAQ